MRGKVYWSLDHRLPAFEIVRDSFLVKYLETDLEGPTVAVGRPISPMQRRLVALF